MKRDESFEAPPLLISVHGIRTTGRWQKLLTEVVQEHGIQYRPIDFGYFTAVSLLLPWARKKKIEWFHQECEDICKSLPPGFKPSVVAHSFGSYLLAGALSKYSDLQFNRVILCGSIIRRDYPWTSIILERGQVDAVLNEAGGRDIWSSMVSWVVADAGASGVGGFYDLGQGRVTQRVHAEHAHSDYFYAGNFRKVWIPFILGNQVGNVLPVASARTNWRFVFFITILFAILIGTAVFFKYSPISPLSEPERGLGGENLIIGRDDSDPKCLELDDDQDGVNNCHDKCPDVGGRGIDGDGCPAPAL